MQQTVETWPLVGFTYRYFWQNKYALLGKIFIFMIILWALSCFIFSFENITQTLFYANSTHGILDFIQIVIFPMIAYAIAKLFSIVLPLSIQYTIARNVLIDTPIHINPLQNIFGPGLQVRCISFYFLDVLRVC